MCQYAFADFRIFPNTKTPPRHATAKFQCRGSVDKDKSTLKGVALYHNVLESLGLYYRSGTVNSNTVNSKFHLIRSYCEIFFYNFPNIPCLKNTVNSNFHLIQSKTLPTNDIKLTVPDLYVQIVEFLMLRYIYVYKRVQKSHGQLSP